VGEEVGEEEKLFLREDIKRTTSQLECVIPAGVSIDFYQITNWGCLCAKPQWNLDETARVFRFPERKEKIERIESLQAR